MHVLAVFVTDEPLFAKELSPKTSMDSNLCFQLALLHPVCYSFHSIDDLLCLHAWFMMLFHLK